MSASSVGLPEALERAATALPEHADDIRPANGDPLQLARLLDPDAAARVLEWLLGNESDAGSELAAAWAEEPLEVAEPLLRVQSEVLPKAGRKALRRALHRLRSRGVEIPETPRREGVATLPPVEDAVHEALVTPIDPTGARAVYLAVGQPAGGVRLFEAMIDDARGVLEFRVYETGRSRVRKFLRDFTKRDRFAAIEVAPESARALIAQAVAAHPSNRPLPRELEAWRSSVAVAEAGARTPGELAREALGAPDPDAGTLERVAKRIAAREIGPWPPALERLQALAQRLAELREGRIIVSGARRREQGEQILEEGLEDTFDDSFRAVQARRFEESAYLSWKGGRDEEARDCLAAARAFREQSCAENRLARAMLELMLAPALAELDDESRDEEEPSLLVKP